MYKWNHFRADMVMDSFITIPRAFEMDLYGVAAEMEKTESVALSYKFINQFNQLSDISKIKGPSVNYNAEESNRRLAEAEDLFCGIAPVNLSGAQFHLGVWDYATLFMGVEQIYIDLMERPELLHAVIGRMTDCVLEGVKKVNEFKICDSNTNLCHCSHIYTEELLPDSGAGLAPITKNCWAFGLAQLFTSVSNEAFEEFELPYISKMAGQFGMIYYGCCDRLDHRLHLVKKIPNVKKISCSPWSDRNAFAENIGPELVMSFKPNPAYIAGHTVDYDVIRQDLLHTYNAAKANHVNLEFILKDISTVNHEPERLARWADIAMEIVNQ